MIVKCVSNTCSTLPPDFLSADYGITTDTRYDITLEKKYLVLAITTLLHYNFFYILEDTNDDCPTLVPSLLFEIVDGRLSKHWQYQQMLTGELLQDFYYMLSFPDWNDGGMFLENLIDGLEPQVTQFKQQLALLQDEFTVE